RQRLVLARAASLLPGPIALDGDLVPGRAAALLAELCENLLGERWIRLPRVHPAEILGLRLTGGVERLAGVESLVGRAVEVQTPGVRIHVLHAAERGELGLECLDLRRFLGDGLFHQHFRLVAYP